MGKVTVIVESKEWNTQKLEKWIKSLLISIPEAIEVYVVPSDEE